MKQRFRIIAVLLCMMILFSTAYAEAEKNIDRAADTMADMIGAEHGKLLAEQEWFPAGNSVCDWLTIAFALGGVNEDYEAYTKSLEEYVSEQYANHGGLDDIKATEYHRIALTVLALGKDPTGFGTAPDGTAIDLIADGTYDFAGELGKQGLNGWIFALIALDSGKYEVPANAKYTREDMISAILTAQTPDGGFGLSRESASVDITAMAVQALAPYSREHSAEIQRALDWLASQMSDNCGFESYGDENSESLSQAIIALCALGIDPAQDERFCRGEMSLLDSLEQFRKEDGAFGHLLTDDGSDALATSQALLAEIAVQRLREDEGSIYDFSRKNTPVQKRNIWIYPAAAIVIAAAAAAILIKRGKRK